jgi:hypothetical protein
MGKKAKEHRAKVAKRNRRIAQEKYSMQNALNKLMKQMAEQQEAEKMEENLGVNVGGSQVPFSVVTDEELNSIVEFKENNPDMFNFIQDTEENVIDVEETHTDGE